MELSLIHILSDILGDEDHLGDMDFKVTGTKDGITATQMDIKVDGLSYEILERALNQAKEGRDVYKRQIYFHRYRRQQIRYSHQTSDRVDALLWGDNLYCGSSDFQSAFLNGEASLFQW